METNRSVELVRVTLDTLKDRIDGLSAVANSSRSSDDLASLNPSLVSHFRFVQIN